MIQKEMLQYLNIWFGIAIMALICTRFKNMKYGFDVIIIRYLFHNDPHPIRWLRYHLIFVYYLGYLFYMVLRTIGLLEQIRFQQLTQKQDIFFISGPMGLLFMGLMLQYFFSKEDRYKKAFDWFIKKTS
jgi:hypothetical protein